MTPAAETRRDALLDEIHELRKKTRDLIDRIQSSDRLANDPARLQVDRSETIMAEHHMEIGFQLLGRSLFDKP